MRILLLIQQIGRCIASYALIIVFMAGVYPSVAESVQWQALTSTSRYLVAFDEESVRLTHLGRLAVWLRFTPRDESHRRAAAVEHGEKAYRSHLEYYEIDCSEQTAVLAQVDIYGTGKARLKRQKGGDQPYAIVQGSVMDRLAERMCPVHDVEASDEGMDAPDPGTSVESKTVAGSKPDADLQRKIQELVQKTADEPGSHEVWSLLGNAYFDADMPDEAIAAYSKALAIRPDDTNILNDQGAMYRQKGEFISALSNFEKAVKIDPYNLESIYNIGYIYAFDLNEIQKALQVWKRYLELDRVSETARQVQSFVERYQ